MPKFTYTFLLVLLLACCLVPAFSPECAANPFQGENNKKKQTETIQAPSALNTMLRHIAAAQKDIRSRMVSLSANMKTNPFGSSFWLFMGFAFAYGVVHALGPGHGKVVIFSYLTGRSRDLLFGLVTGSALAVIHVLSAVMVILVFLALHGQASHTEFERVMGWTELSCYALIAAIGTGLAASSLKRIMGRSKPDENKTQTTKGLGVALAAGLIPCPGAAIILLFSLSIGIFAQGLMAMSALAAGMALTISGVALLAVIGNRSLPTLAAGKKRFLERAYSALTIAGALVMAAFGTMMFIDRL